jgi:hypothetical protein
MCALYICVCVCVHYIITNSPYFHIIQLAILQLNRYSKYQENLARIYQHQRERKERKRENLLNESQAEIAELKEELDKIKRRILQWVKISGKYTTVQLSISK